VGQQVSHWLESQEDGSNQRSNQQLGTDDAIDLPQESYTTNKHQPAATAILGTEKP